MADGVGSESDLIWDDFGGQKIWEFHFFRDKKMFFKRNFYHFFTQTDATKFRKINGKSLNCNILHKILHLCCVLILTKMYGFLWFLCDILGAKGRYPWQSDTISVVHSMNFMSSFYNFFEEKTCIYLKNIFIFREKFTVNSKNYIQSKILSQSTRFSQKYVILGTIGRYQWQS